MPLSARFFRPGTNNRRISAPAPGPPNDAEGGAPGRWAFGFFLALNGPPTRQDAAETTNAPAPDEYPAAELDAPQRRLFGAYSAPRRVGVR